MISTVELKIIRNFEDNSWVVYTSELSPEMLHLGISNENHNICFVKKQNVVTESAKIAPQKLYLNLDLCVHLNT